jgi:hypothetical protein
MPAFTMSEALGTPSSTGNELCSTTPVVGSATALAASGAGAAESFAFKSGDASTSVVVRISAVQSQVASR